MKITAEEFKTRTERNPNWCSKITEPIEVTEYVTMIGSNIQSLSPLLTFTGKDANKHTANFLGCQQLKIAEGTFQGFVGFANSGIEKIGDLKINYHDVRGAAASFFMCEHLKIAEGSFPGYVTFQSSGIQEIGILHIAKTDHVGDAANFKECKSLRIAKGDYPGHVDFDESNVTTAIHLKIHQPNLAGTAISFYRCLNLRKIRGEFNGVIIADDFLIEEYNQHRAIQKVAKQQAKESTLKL